jgi:outer membrane protein OmpA-like peptidoglycan-associated protein
MKLFFSIFIFIFLLVQFCFGQDSEVKTIYNPLSNKIAITGEAGITIGQTDYKNFSLNYFAKSSLEYYFYSKGAGLFSLRGFANTGIVSGKDNARVPNAFNTTIYDLGLAVGYTYSTSDKIYPYAAIGLSSMWYFPKDNNGKKLPHISDRQMGTYDGELGIRYMVSGKISLNISYGIILATKDYLDNLKSGSNNDLVHTITAGLSFYFGRNKGSGNESDLEYFDKFPSTTKAFKIDSTVHPFDFDSLRILDSFFKYPNIPKVVIVDSALRPIKKDSVIEKIFVLDGYSYFAPGNYKLLSDAYIKIDSLVKSIREKHEYIYSVEGYTDSRGSDESCLNLSYLRAQAVVNYLISLGVDRNSLIIKAFGKANPIASNKTAEGREKNNRIVIKMLSFSDK